MGAAQDRLNTPRPTESFCNILKDWAPESRNTEMCEPRLINPGFDVKLMHFWFKSWNEIVNEFHVCFFYRERYLRMFGKTSS